MPKTKFEAVFREFVEDFGGEIVPEEAEDGKPSADYFFRQHNVVAELKCTEIIDQRRAGEQGRSLLVANSGNHAAMGV